MLRGLPCCMGCRAERSVPGSGLISIGNLLHPASAPTPPPALERYTSTGIAPTNPSGAGRRCCCSRSCGCSCACSRGEYPPMQVVNGGDAQLALPIEYSAHRPSAKCCSTGSCAKVGFITSSTVYIPPAVSEVARTIRLLLSHAPMPQWFTISAAYMFHFFVFASYATLPPQLEVVLLGECGACSPEPLVAGWSASTALAWPRHCFHCARQR